MDISNASESIGYYLVLRFLVKTIISVIQRNLKVNLDITSMKKNRFHSYRFKINNYKFTTLKTTYTKQKKM